MEEGAEFEFVCPECEQTIEVNASMRDALIENGCVICAAAVTPNAFSPAGGADASTGSRRGE